MGEFEESLGYLGAERDGLLKALQEGEQSKIAILDERLYGEQEAKRRFPFLTPDPNVKGGFSYPASIKLGASLSYFAGAFSIQDPSSALPAALLSPRKGERVLDMCAAPGGKSIQIALGIGDSGLLIANDKSHGRALSLSSNLERMGLGNAIVTCFDFLRDSPFPSGYFDAILLDAPCSGEAMFRKDAEARRDWSLAKVSSCAQTQASLLEVAAKLLRPGGRMVYSTCSFAYEEDIGMVKGFLSRHSDFRPLCPISDERIFRHTDFPEAAYCLPHRYPGEGQFACLLIKEGNEERRNPRLSKTQISSEAKERLSALGLDGYSFASNQEAIYACREPFPISRFIRYGYQALLLPRFEPSNGVKRLLPKLTLSEKEAILFLQGQELPMPGEGYVCAYYAALPLGIGKLGNGKMKNRLPKGLRRRFAKEELI